MKKNKIENKVINFINKYSLVCEQDRIMIGVSGGADSIYLLFALKELMPKMNLTIVAVHINHGLRGEFAKRDEEFVKEICKNWNIPCYTYQVKAKEVAKKEKLSIEEAGRTLRREIFARVMGETNSNKIALAHHQNDNAETLLLNLIRGTGLRGMGGIKPIRGEYIRPLLCLTRKEIEEELQARNIPYCEDETNEDINFSRNRIRKKVIPHLEEINVKAVNHLSDSVFHLGELGEFVDERVEEGFKHCVLDVDISEAIQKPEFTGLLREKHPRNDGSMSLAIVPSKRKYMIHKERLYSLPVFIQRFVILKTLEKSSLEKRDWNKRHVESVLNLLDSQVGRRIHLPYDLVGYRDYQGVLIYPKMKEDNQKSKNHDNEKKDRKRDIEITLEIPSKTRFLELNLAIECKLVCREGINAKDTSSAYEGLTTPRTSPTAKDSMSKSISAENSNNEPSHFTYTKSIDYDIINSGLSLRTREEGDFITIDKKGSRQKLKSYFINEKIPSHKRDKIPLLADGKEIIWIIGYRMSTRYQVTQNTKKILEIKIMEEGETWQKQSDQ